MRLSLLSMEIIQDQEAKNIDIILKYARKIALEGTSTILLTPELSLQGFPDSFENSVKATKPESIEAVKQIASKYSLSIGFGYLEQQHEYIYNVYSIVNHEGKIIATQRKRKTFNYVKENLYIRAAKDTEDFDIAGLRTRIVVCFGLRFPELFSNKADSPYLYIIPANWPVTRIQHWEALLIARAIENQAWVIGVNRTGGNYNGHSLVISPNGNVILRNNESLASFSIDKETVSQLREEFPLNEEKKS